MRLSRIMIVIAAGFTLLGVPTAAGAAQPFPPQPSVTPTTDSPGPQPTATTTIPPSPEPTVSQPPYAPTQPILTSPDPTIFVNEPVVIEGDGWAPGETVTLTFSLLPAAARLPGARPQADTGGVGAMAPAALPARQLPGPIEVEADANGHFSTEVNLDEVGSILVTATGESGTATLVVTVLPRPTQPPSGGLPVTGSSLGGPIGIGAAAVAIGALLMLVAVAWRRRAGRGGPEAMH